MIMFIAGTIFGMFLSAVMAIVLFVLAYEDKHGRFY